MTGKTQDTWYYIVVQNPGQPGEQIMGYTDDETGTVFIPCFESKEVAQQCFLLMPKDAINQKYEIQAIIKDDLKAAAKEKEYDIFLLDHKGQILEQIFSGEAK